MGSGLLPMTLLRACFEGPLHRKGRHLLLCRAHRSPTMRLHSLAHNSVAILQTVPVSVKSGRHGGACHDAGLGVCAQLGVQLAGSARRRRAAQRPGAGEAAAARRAQVWHTAGTCSVHQQQTRIVSHKLAALEEAKRLQRAALPWGATAALCYKAPTCFCRNRESEASKLLLPRKFPSLLNHVSYSPRSPAVRCHVEQRKQPMANSKHQGAIPFAYESCVSAVQTVRSAGASCLCLPKCA